ncbi:MAG: carboxypeptidase-like regulatory domain-containing protein, partial [Candidatus Saccharicenans sp.]
MKKKFLSVLLVIILFSIFQTTAMAQAGRGLGRLGGVVLDEQDKPIAGAKVTLTYIQDIGGGLKLESVTNKKGEWSFIGLGTGKWSIAAEAKGYLPVSQEVTV